MVSEAEALQASFCRKGIEAARRALDLMRSQAGDALAQERNCFYLWQAMDVCYLYAEAWEVVVECALQAHDEMVRTGRWARWIGYLDMALNASRQIQDGQAEMRLLLHLAGMHERCGEWGLARQRLDEALSLAERCADDGIRGRALITLASLERQAGRLDEAQRQIDLALAALEASGDAQALSEAYRGLGNLLLQRGDDGGARTAYFKALEFAGLCGDLHCLASAYHNLGNLSAQRGESNGAAVQYNRALELFRQTGDQAGEAIALSSIGLACQADRGYWRQAVETFREVVGLAEKAGHFQAHVVALSNLVDTALKLGQVEQAAAAVEELQALYARTGSAYGLAAVEHDRGTICLARGEPAAALACFERARQSPEWTSDAEEMAPAETNVGRAWAMLGEWEAAEAAYERAFNLWATFTELPGQMETWLSLVSLYRQAGNWRKLAPALEAAWVLAEQIGREDSLALLEAAQADAYFAAGDAQAGCQAYAAALYRLLRPGENDRKIHCRLRVIEQAWTQIEALENAGRNDAAAALQAVIRAQPGQVG